MYGARVYSREMTSRVINPILETTDLPAKFESVRIGHEITAHDFEVGRRSPYLPLVRLWSFARSLKDIKGHSLILLFASIASWFL